MSAPASSIPATGYLTGQLLIASPGLVGDVFSKSVVYICDHSAFGAMGVIVNNIVANIRLGNVLKELNLLAGGDISDLPVHFGGPVESQRGFIVHTGDITLPETIVGPGGICMTASVGMLRGISEGRQPRRSFLALGYAGWDEGQLEAEIASGSWITAPATEALVFDANNDDKWALAGASLGVIDMSRLSPDIGHA